MRKGIKPIKCVGWLICAKRDIPKRRREGGRGSNGVKGRPRAMEWIKEDWSWNRRTRKKAAVRKRRRAGGRD